MSTGCTSSVLYPFSSKIAKSLARVLGSQLTYTILSALILVIAFNNLISQPFLGGSTTTISAFTPLFIKSGITTSDSPTKNSTLSTLFSLAFIFAFSIACGIISTP